jgi:hypothetical protein
VLAPGPHPERGNSRVTARRPRAFLFFKVDNVLGGPVPPRYESSPDECAVASHRRPRSLRSRGSRGPRTGTPRCRSGSTGRFVRRRKACPADRGLGDADHARPHRDAVALRAHDLAAHPPHAGLPRGPGADERARRPRLREARLPPPPRRLWHGHLRQPLRLESRSRLGGQVVRARLLRVRAEELARAHHARAGHEQSSARISTPIISTASARTCRSSDN